MRWHDVFLIASLPFTRLLLYEIYDLIEINIWFMDDAMLIFVCLLDSRGGGGGGEGVGGGGVGGGVGFTAIWYQKSVDVNLYRLSPLYYKRTD